MTAKWGGENFLPPGSGRRAGRTICWMWHMADDGVDTSKQLKPVEWVGSSLRDLRAMPEPVVKEFGFALYQAQLGRKHVSAKPLKGFGGGGVLEAVESSDGDAYRCVYTVRLAGAVYVLHAFQKKSKSGIATPKEELDLVRQRLKAAEEHHAERAKGQVKQDQTRQRKGKR